MVRKKYFSGIGKIKNISFGLFYIFFTIWLLFHSAQYFPEEFQDEWLRIIILYGLLNALMFGVPDIRNKLFNIKLIKFIPRFLMFFFSGLVLYYLLLNYSSHFGDSLFSILKNVPVWLAVVHAFIFATTESAVWQGYLDEKIGHPWSELSAGVMHLFIWSGGAVIVIFSATMLFMMFSVANWYFRKDTYDLAPAIGLHTAWNIIKLGMLVTTASVI